MLIAKLYKGGISGDDMHNWITSDGVQESYLSRLIKRGGPLNLAMKGMGQIKVEEGYRESGSHTMRSWRK